MLPVSFDSTMPVCGVDWPPEGGSVIGWVVWAIAAVEPAIRRAAAAAVRVRFISVSLLKFVERTAFQ